MKFPSSITSLALLLGLAAAATTPDCSRKFKCLMDYEPICGSDGKTYANECVFNNAVCLAIAQKTPPLTKLFEGPCTMDPNPFCSTGCTKIYKPVCGTDGKTYGNSCTLRAAKCKNLLLEVAYEGECKPTPQPTKPACRDACPENYKPVCGSNNVTYSNACEMEAACCKNPGLKLSKAYDGECGCVKGCPKIFLQVCGSDGKTYNNKCLLTNAACVNLTLTVAHDGPCEIDSASACAAVSCRQFSECKVDDATGKAYCADVCDPKRCAADEVCSLQQVQCVTSPCPPVAKCTKRA